MYSKKATIDFYFNMRDTRSSSKKKELSRSESESSSSAKKLKTLSNPEKDFTTPEKGNIGSPTSTTSTIENRINQFNVTPSSRRNGQSVDSVTTTPVSKKNKPATVQKGSASKRQAGVDHNKQYVIDAGQKDFDGMKTCNDCGMVYTKGIKEDELHHKNFHESIVGKKDSAIVTTPAKASKRITITPSPKSLFLKLKSLKWSVNSKLVSERVLEWVQPTGFANGGSGRIIGFTSDELLKNEKLLNLVDKYFRKAGQEIGIESGILDYNQLFMHIPNRSPSIFLLMIVSTTNKAKSMVTPKSALKPVPIPKTPTTSKSKGSAVEGVTPCRESLNSSDYVVGLISCESINTAERLISENPLSCTTNQNIPAKVGVSRLWVSSATRRCNVATQLLDALRRHFMTMTAKTSQVVPKEQVAFSDPTESGLKFAQKYFGRKDILVFSLFHSLTPAAIEEL